jgi:hypothetical protein
VKPCCGADGLLKTGMLNETRAQWVAELAGEASYMPRKRSSFPLVSI